MLHLFIITIELKSEAISYKTDYDHPTIAKV